MARRSKKKEAQALEQDTAQTYNEFKEFEGQRYTGVKIGRGHKWNYDAGVWKERKITPDEWEINYNVTKRRAGKAPEGSGVPVGTQYHWYIIAHQNVTKLNANDYSTSMTGVKFKVAHKRADKETWSATTKTQKKRTLKFLKQLVADLEEQLEVEEESNVIPLRPKKVARKKKEKKAA
ncbi:hypothetical protein ACJVC5_04290 [Peredibacter sp. HCB2-198]|uniref:hypothetical protein n=1 Tax=Peredibacter sp. HCB2-198 TaxID=3383025 RepID=UPI0038B6675E